MASQVLHIFHRRLTFSLREEHGQEQHKQRLWDPQQHGDLPTAWVRWRGQAFRVTPAEGQPVYPLPTSCPSEPASQAAPSIF